MLSSKMLPARAEATGPISWRGLIKAMNLNEQADAFFLKADTPEWIS